MLGRPGDYIMENCNNLCTAAGLYGGGVFRRCGYKSGGAGCITRGRNAGKKRQVKYLPPSSEKATLKIDMSNLTNEQHRNVRRGRNTKCFGFFIWEMGTPSSCPKKTEKSLKYEGARARGMQIKLTRARTFSSFALSLQRMQTNWTCLMQEIHYGVVPMHTGRTTWPLPS